MALSACTRKGVDEPGMREPGGRKLNIICTTFPQYDWVRQILGEQAETVELILLLDNKIDLHSYQPAVADIVKISSCDLFIYVGGESDAWVDDVLKDAVNEDMIVISLLEALGDAAKIEEIVEGMEDEEHEDEWDEHVWLSLKNAQILCTAIADVLAALDADHTDTYQSNLRAYTEKLSALDAEYQEAVAAAPVKTLLFGDRFPFRYLVEDYGLTYFAAFAGCAAEAEAGFQTIIFLADKVDELGLHTICVTESADQSIAKTIRDSTAAKNQNILVLDAMQSVTRGDIENGISYLAIMESNLSMLKAALS